MMVMQKLLLNIDKILIPLLPTLGAVIRVGKDSLQANAPILLVALWQAQLEAEAVDHIDVPAMVINEGSAFPIFVNSLWRTVA